MATLAFFHAHPDDEAITTGGSIARAAAEGHRVVVIVATDGALGETPDDLGPTETLVDRRRSEMESSVAVLGAQRLAWLGYADSGMTGWEQNASPASFHLADVDEAGERLAAILREENVDLLVTYDWHGNYGHPDHIKVHTVGYRAAELAQTPSVFEATVNRDEMRRFSEQVRLSAPGDDDFDPDGPADDGNPMGEPESEISLRVDVSQYIGQKRSALARHRSQVTDSSFFLQMPDEAFTVAFGTEWFKQRDVAGPPKDGWLVTEETPA
jgi:LmbE family N-acetylglucosaminyl deacetylase